MNNLIQRFGYSYIVAIYRSEFKLPTIVRWGYVKNPDLHLYNSLAVGLTYE